MAKFFCSNLTESTSQASYVELVDVPDGYASFTHVNTPYTVACSDPHYIDDSFVSTSASSSFSCGVRSNYRNYTSEITIDDVGEGEWGYGWNGEWQIVTCSSPEFSGLSDTTTQPSTDSYTPTPADIVSAVGAGFFTVLPIILVVFGGRQLLSMFSNRY